MNPIWMWLWDLFYPPKCMLCRRLLPDSSTVLCGRCHYDLPEWEGALRKIPGFAQCAAPFTYEEPIRGAVLRFKFHGMLSYADQFAQWMAIRIRDEIREPYDYVTWVPCSRKRRRRRGFDQAEILARALARELCIEARPTLEKFRDNPPQSGTKSASRRRANVLGVYRVLPGEELKGHRILVVDDIITTGATISECGRMLRMAGAETLTCTAIAITKQEDNK